MVLTTPDDTPEEGQRTYWLRNKQQRSRYSSENSNYRKLYLKSSKKHG